jgi:hypothetical protein
MANLHRADISNLGKRIDTLSDALARLKSAELKQLLLIIRRPGWTTPAELAFASGIVAAMLGQAKALKQLQAVLLKGSRAVNTGQR